MGFFTTGTISAGRTEHWIFKNTKDIVKEDLMTSEQYRTSH